MASRKYRLFASASYLPASNLHSDETIVWHSASDLKLAHAMLSGETSFEDTNDVAARHEQSFAEAYISKSKPPEISFDVDDVLDGERNVWLPKFHIDVKADYSMFAAGIRTDRASAEASLKSLADTWASKKPTFDAVLKHELASYGSASRQALAHSIMQAEKAIRSDDPKSILDLRTAVMDRCRGLQLLFQKHGVPSSDSHVEVFRFWDWPGNEEQPIHRISAYLFAALAWRISSGQRSDMKASILNDFNAIATYAPYVDAMFIDKQCASLLQQGRLRTELKLKGRIFSLNSQDEFLQYLRELGDSAALNVRAYANDIYGLG